MSPDNSVFLDFPVLIDFCVSYSSSFDSTRDIISRLKSNNWKVYVSENAYRKFNSRMSNRNRIVDHLIDKASEYIRDSENPYIEYKADVLNYSNLSRSMSFNFNSTYLPDLENLQQEYENSGIGEFRKALDGCKSFSSVQRKKLRRMVNEQGGEYDRGGRGTLSVEVPIKNIAKDNTHAESLMDTVYWCQHFGQTVLVRHEGRSHENRSQLSNAIESVCAREPTITSPEEVL